MNTFAARVLLVVALGLIGVIVQVRGHEEPISQDKAAKGKTANPKDLEGWTTEFNEDKKDLTHTGRNTYFILEPGYYHILEKGNVRIEIVVTNETKMIDGVETRVVIETETKGGKVVEITKDYFAISKRTNNVYYMGEDVDIYKDGKIVGHGGTWHSGVNGAKYGLMMAATPMIKGKYYQEIAPGAGMDRAEIVSMSETVVTKAGTFKNCLKTEETTPLEPDVKDYKYYAPGVGIVSDSEDTRLVEYGFKKDKK